MISINAPTSNEDQTIEDSLTDDEDYEENLAIREATKEEIIELSTQLRAFGVSLTDIADNSPKQERTLAACKRVVAYVKEDAELMEDFLRTKRLPLKKLTDGSKVARKKIERHRKYIIGLLLIYTNGYEIIRGHLAEVMKGVTV